MGTWRLAAVLMGLVATTVVGALLLSRVSTGRAGAPDGVGAPSGLLPLRETLGRIEWIDEARRELSVRLDRQLQRFVVDKSTTVFVDGRTGSLSDLVPGQVVKASFEPGSEPPVAEWIEVDPT